MGIGIFLLLRSTQMLILRGDRACMAPSIYLDVHGEVRAVPIPASSKHQLSAMVAGSLLAKKVIHYLKGGNRFAPEKGDGPVCFCLLCSPPQIRTTGMQAESF
jgi:hypothetical protein